VFAEQCAQHGVVFIGPPASAIRAMGSKSASKTIMSKAKVPVVPGYHGEDQDNQRLISEADKMGYPVLIKPVKGGGGKGMKIVWKSEDMLPNLESSRREAKASFGSEGLLIERYLQVPRHIEFQIFGDNYDNYLYLFERDCSLQRRHQKVIEEAPGPGVSEELRRAMGQSAVNAARAVGYRGAGTVEFIMDTTDNQYYFMEMNTRLQVEHPVTEMITGQDLVEWQFRVANGQPLPITQQDQLRINGHAFEARIYAENPLKDFLPSTGTLVVHDPPASSEQVRVDTGVSSGDVVSVYYDPMIAKLIVHDVDRPRALRRLTTALEQYKVAGVHNNIEFLKRCATHPEFIAGNVETNFIAKFKDELLPQAKDLIKPRDVGYATLFAVLHEQLVARDSSDPWQSADAFRVNHTAERVFTWRPNIAQEELTVHVAYHADHSFTLTVQHDKHTQHVMKHVRGTLQRGKEKNSYHVTADLGNTLQKFEVMLGTHGEITVHSVNGLLTLEPVLPKLEPASRDAKTSAASLQSPMPGKVIKVNVTKGDQVSANQSLLILEAMKMEHTIRSPYAGTVTAVNYKTGDLVEENKVLITIEPLRS
jgi:3-methylcrotonyl-CoA carboxylase alpha subunit